MAISLIINKYNRRNNMLKQRLAINRVNKSLSLDKIHKTLKDNNILKEGNSSKQKKNSIIISKASPMKKLGKQNHNRWSLLAQKKVQQKFDIRRKSDLPNLLKLSHLQIGKNEVENKESEKLAFLLQIKDIFRNDVTSAMIDETTIRNNSYDHLIIKRQTFTDLLVKLSCAFLLNTKEEYQTLQYLDENLKKVKSLILDMNKKYKLSKIRLWSEKSKFTNFNDTLSQYVKTQKIQIVKLDNQKSQLIYKVKQLSKQTENIEEYNRKKLKEIQKGNMQINENKKNIDKKKQQYIIQSRNVETISLQLQRCQSDYEKIVTFVQKQGVNQHVKNAKEIYLQIESDMFEYAVYCQHNQLANSYTYQSIPMMNERYVLNNLDENMKFINRKILGNDYSLDQKLKIMRDFIVQIDSRHKKLNQEYINLLDFKTEQILKYVSAMKRYLENWELKKQYLVNLRKEFAVDNRLIKQAMNHLFQEKTCWACYQKNQKDYIKIQTLYKKIEENYKYGNCFY